MRIENGEARGELFLRVMSIGRSGSAGASPSLSGSASDSKQLITEAHGGKGIPLLSLRSNKSTSSTTDVADNTNNADRVWRGSRRAVFTSDVDWPKRLSRSFALRFHHISVDWLTVWKSFFTEFIPIRESVRVFAG